MALELAKPKSQKTARNEAIANDISALFPGSRGIPAPMPARLLSYYVFMMCLPTALFLIGPLPPCRFPALFFAADILPPLVFFAILLFPCPSKMVDKQQF